MTPRASLVSYALLLALCFCSLPGRAAAIELEYKLKAAYLYNFSRFVTWPESAFAEKNSPLFFCTLVEDPFGSALDELTQKKVRGHPLAVRRIEHIAQAKSCHILFIPTSQHTALPHIFSALDGRPVLTVGDNPDFGRAGGMLGFTLQGKRVRFVVNVQAGKKAKLHISVKLIRLAAEIYGGNMDKGKP